MLRDEGGRARTLPVDVWLGRAGAVDERVLDRARGPVLDVGCGPGRHVHALARRGVLGVGVDVSPVAVASPAGAARGVRGVDLRSPAGGGELGQRAAARRQHRHRRRLRTRCCGVSPDCSHRAGPCSSSSTRRASASCASACAWSTATRASEWFAWAQVGADAVDGPARAAGLRVRARWHDGDRWFARAPGAVKAPPGPTRGASGAVRCAGHGSRPCSGSLLLPLVLVVAATGFFSHAAYQPGLGRNAVLPPGGLQPFGFGWPATPSWLYAVNQGLHVTVGIVAVPLLLAKLWSVIPRLFAWPPVRSPAQAIERLSLAGARRRRDLRVRHRHLQHPALLPVALQLRPRALLRRLGLPRGAHHPRGDQAPGHGPRVSRAGVLAPLRADLERTRAEPHEPGGLAPPAPAAPTHQPPRPARPRRRRVRRACWWSRRAGGRRSAAAPRVARAARAAVFGDGPNDFQVNKTAAAAGISRR